MGSCERDARPFGSGCGLAVLEGNRELAFGCHCRLARQCDLMREDFSESPSRDDRAGTSPAGCECSSLPEPGAGPKKTKKTDMDAFLTTGITLGLSAGLSPGPLTTLVISHSLQHGAREGLKVAMAPFITDVPIILVSVFALAQLRDSQTALGLISMIGAAVLLSLAYESFKADKVEVADTPTDARSLGKGALVNFFSPHPYLFWLTIGAPRVVEAWTLSPLTAVAFIAGFYVCLIGSKMSMALVAARSRRMLAGTAYRYVMRFLGVALVALAVWLFRDALVFFHVLRP